MSPALSDAALAELYGRDPEHGRLEAEALAKSIAQQFAEYKVRVAERFTEEHRAQLLELRSHFRAKPRAERIFGCSNWEGFCKRVFDRRARTIDYRLVGGNNNRRKAETVSVIPAPIRPAERPKAAVELVPSGRTIPDQSETYTNKIPFSVPSEPKQAPQMQICPNCHGTGMVSVQ
jgi:hypothetical protein